MVIPFPLAAYTSPEVSVLSTTPRLGERETQLESHPLDARPVICYGGSDWPVHSAFTHTEATQRPQIEGLATTQEGKESLLDFANL